MSASAMNTSVRNNLNLLSKRDRLKNRLGGFNREEKTEYNLPKASTKQLNEIRKRLQEERKVRMLKVIILTVILFVGLVFVFLHSAKGITELLTY